MAYIPLLRANVMHGVIALLQQLHAPTEPLLAEAKLPPSILYESEALLPLQQVLDFIENAALVLQIEHFGLLAGQQTQIAQLGALGRILCHSLTLQDAIYTLIRLLPSYNSGDRMWLKSQGNVIWICRQFINGLEQSYPQAVQVSVMCLIHLIQLAAGPQWHPTEIHLAMPPTRGFDQVRILADTNVLFNQEVTAIAVPITLLSLPLQQPAQVENQQRDRDYQILYSSAPATNFPASLKQMIRIHLKHDYSNIRAIAEILGVSVRSFQRQLSQANVTYSQLIEQVR
ncbi:MAG TPA: AraC family transcriptional regulator ligand-binding domain-containing protein, partial [Microcoleaceae cyanobacterium]